MWGNGLNAKKADSFVITPEPTLYKAEGFPPAPRLRVGEDLFLPVLAFAAAANAKTGIFLLPFLLQEEGAGGLEALLPPWNSVKMRASYFDIVKIGT